MIEPNCQPSVAPDTTVAPRWLGNLPRALAVAVLLALALTEAWRLRQFLRINAGPKLA